MRGKRTPVDLILGLNQWFQEEEYPETFICKKLRRHNCADARIAALPLAAA
jgi:hypothetical protein